jgi:DNA-binding response OmpR family regulator
LSKAKQPFRLFSKKEVRIKPSVLVIEDDPIIADGMCAVLRSSGYTVHWSGDGSHAYAQLATESYDLLVLDLGIPRLDGLKLLKQIREEGSRVPVLIVSARIEIDERVKGFETGANDYLTKPFDLKEFLARSRALLGAASVSKGTKSLKIGGLELDTLTRKATIHGQPVSLTPREYDILEVLFCHPDTVVTKEQMVKMISVEDEVITDNFLAVNVSRLRKKLLDVGDCIRTVRGFGYLFSSRLVS